MNYEWSVHVSEKEGLLTSLRLNEGINDYVCHPQYKYFLGVSVSFRSSAASGLPDEAEKNILTELEALIAEQLLDNMLCVLAAVVTENGCKSFIMYTYSPLQSEKTLQILNETWMYHDVTFVLQEDPDWKVFETLIE